MMHPFNLNTVDPLNRRSQNLVIIVSHFCRSITGILLEYRVEILQVCVSAICRDLFDRVGAKYQTFLGLSELAVKDVLIDGAAYLILELVSKVVRADEELLCQ